MESNTKTIADSIQDYLKSEKPFVFYRKKKSVKVTCLVQKDSALYTTSNFSESGFVFAAYNSTKASILFPINQLEEFFFETPIKKKSKTTVGRNIALTAKDNYIKLLQKTINFIRRRKADKVVISRSIKRDYNNKQVGLIFENLLDEYTNAFVYIWYHPKVGLWMGATPESLLNVNKDFYSTMALAGTKQKNDKIDWSEKEKMEQQWVTDFITDQLIPITNNLKISNPYTDHAGHLAHIRTDINGQLLDNVGLQDLIKRLHPTPAVCGTPRNVAKKFINENEGYDRNYYTGFLGELNINNKTDLFVNLRCMQLHDSYVTLYVGGGITKDSIPEEEWEETVSKAMVLGKFLS